MKIFSTLILLTSFSTPLLAPAQSQTQPVDTWQMPEAEKSQWLRTLKFVASPNEWNISNQGNSFTVEHKIPVPLQAPAWINAMPNSPQSRAKIHFEQQIYITLRFSPLISDKEWLYRQNQNLVAAEENEKLMEQFNIKRMLGISCVSGQDAPIRLKKYQNEARKLTAYHLPQLHSADRNVLVGRSWTRGEIDETNPVGRECLQTLEAMHALFKNNQMAYSYLWKQPLDENSPRHDIYWLNLNEETAKRPPYPVAVSIQKPPTS